jgi:hypothetical protein
VYKADFEVQPEQDAAKIRSFEGMYRLLAFADALDSTPGVLDSCLGDVSELELHANMGKQQLVLCPAKGDYTLASLQLLMQGFGGTEAEEEELGVPAANKEQVQGFKQQVAAQTEQLLWLAYRLQLQPLVQCLHAFIRTCCLFDISLLRGRLDVVFTHRVLEAIGVSSLTCCKGAWINSVLCQDISFSDSIAGAALLQPVGAAAAERGQQIVFDAVLKSEILGIAAGTQVKLRLDIFRGRLYINGDEHVLHFRVGHHVHEHGEEDERAREQGGLVFPEAE